MLVPALRAGLKNFVAQLLSGELPQRKDYGLLHFCSQLSSNYGDTAQEVVGYMDELVQEATGGAQAVVFASPKYFAETYKSGMTLALVPDGQDASSLDARLFEFGGAINGNRFSERASAEAIAEAEVAEANNERRCTMSFAANQLEADFKRRLVEKVRSKVVQALDDATLAALTDVQRDDLVRLANIKVEDFGPQLRAKVAACTHMSVLCQLLVILNKQDMIQL